MTGRIAEGGVPRRGLLTGKVAEGGVLAFRDREAFPGSIIVAQRVLLTRPASRFDDRQLAAGVGLAVRDRTASQ